MASLDGGTMRLFVPKNGAEGQSRTDTGLPPPVFETGASTIPPLRPTLDSIPAPRPTSTAPAHRRRSRRNLAL